MGKHILLSSMGASGPRPSRYFFDRQEEDSEPHSVTAGFSALGLWRLLPATIRPDEIWFLLTPRAKEVAWPSILSEATEVSATVKPLLLQDTEGANDTELFLATIAEQLPPNIKLTLDVTQGLRHHAFLFYALALYVSRFRENELQGVWYSRLETERPEDPKPIIDLKPVLELANWFSALSEFQDTGSLKRMSQLVADGRLQKLLNQLSREFLTGLPVEAGLTAKRVKKILEGAEGLSLARVPLEKQVREKILEEISPLAGSYDKKSECLLNDDELERQARFVDRYLRAGQANLAFGFMREWSINHVLHKEGVVKDWLDLKQRSRAEGQLGCLKNLNSQNGDPNREKLSEALRDQAKRWDDLGGVRNSLQHHGMRPDEVPGKPMKRLKESWKTRSQWEGLPVFGGGAGTLLICPLGNTPGVLFSSLLHVQPQRCLVLCSPQTVAKIDEAVAEAGWNGLLEKLVMEDVHRGVNEFGRLINQAKPWLFEADSIEANLTGGTSLMGVLVGRLVEHAGRTYRRPHRRFVLIDGRAPEVQQTAPWMKGDIHYIDEKSGQAGGEG